MESKRIKSAWEIALERAERLGSLSSDELRAKQEEEWREIGRGLGARWLAGLPARDLRLEVSRQEAARRAIVVKQAVSLLSDALSLHLDEKTERALEGLRLLVEADALRPLEDRLRSLSQEYKQLVARERDNLEREARVTWDRELHRRGISGTAVQLNVQALPEWQAAMQRLEDRYRDRLLRVQRQVKELC